MGSVIEPIMNKRKFESLASGMNSSFKSTVIPSSRPPHARHNLEHRLCTSKTSRNVRYNVAK